MPRMFADVALLDEKPCGYVGIAGKVYLPIRVPVLVRFEIVPLGGPTRVEQHDGAVGHRPMFNFPRFDIFDVEKRVGIGPRSIRNIDDHGRSPKIV
jgi:hypothetical protein